MNIDFDFPLSDFEKITADQLVSFKASKEEDIERLVKCPKIINEARALVLKWDKYRISKNLKRWNN